MPAENVTDRVGGTLGQRVVTAGAPSIELTLVKTLRRMLEARRTLVGKGIANGCRLSARGSKGCRELLVDGELLSVGGAGESDAGKEFYRKSVRGLKNMNPVTQVRGGCL